MKKGRFIDEQIIGILKQHEAGRKVPDLAREHGASESTIYTWKSNAVGWMSAKQSAIEKMRDEWHLSVTQVHGGMKIGDRDTPGSRIYAEREYRMLFSPRHRRRPGPKGPNQDLIEAVVAMQRRNPGWGCPCMAQQISLAFGVPIDKDAVRRVLSVHYRLRPGELLEAILHSDCTISRILWRDQTSKERCTFVMA